MKRFKKKVDTTERRQENEILVLKQAKHLLNYSSGESGSEFLVRFRDLKP